MKKFACALSLALVVSALVVCCSVFSSGNFAYADTTTNGNIYDFTVGSRNVRLVTVVYGDTPVGVRMSGYYFGASGIPVTVDVYSSPASPIDFRVGEDNLTAAQLSTRTKLVELFTNISQMIDAVDSLANTTYDGSSLGNNQLPTSDIYRYNRAANGDKLEISRETYEMLLLAREMYEETEGAFNPAVYRLVDLWGFSSRIYTQGKVGQEVYDRTIDSTDTGYKLPDEKYVSAFSAPQFTDFSQKSVTLSEEGGKYFVTKNVAPAVVDGVLFEQWLDLGGIAKGYAVDKAREMVATAGFDRYYVDAGTSSMALGLDYDGGEQILGLSDAFDPLSAIFTTSLFELNVSKSSVSTSGQNIRKYTVDGVEYAHIIDGALGAPAQTGVRSVMIIAPEGDFWATKGDCLTTALTVMGRDKIVEFVNGYLKENDVKIVVLYQTLDGKKQILSNIDENDVLNTSDSFGEFNWSLKQDASGNFYYDANAKFQGKTNGYTWILITLGCIVGAGVIALVVYHLVRGKRALANVQHARRDKPFKVADIFVYLLVALVIVVLLVDVFSAEDANLQVVSVVDDDASETLFVYNVVRGEYLINTENTNGWIITVVETASGIEVTLSREIDGETHFNTVTITRGQKPSVKMTDSLCGFHKDCVRNFPAITRSGGVIVCSPNRLKIVTE